MEHVLDELRVTFLPEYINRGKGPDNDSRADAKEDGLAPIGIPLEVLACKLG